MDIPVPTIPYTSVALYSEDVAGASVAPIVCGESTVYFVQHCEGIDDLLILRVPNDLTASNIREVETEMVKMLSNLYRLQHPNVIKVYGIVKGGDGPYRLGALMQRAPFGDLSASLALRGRNSQPSLFGASFRERLEWAMDIVRALEFCHSKDVVHCDIKPANILLGENRRAILTDFGFALNLQAASRRTSKSTSVQQSNLKGSTLGYSAPEIIDPTFNGKAADIYSLGITLIDILSGRLYWDGMNDRQIIRAQATDTVPDVLKTFTDIHSDYASFNLVFPCTAPAPELVDLLKSMTSNEPERRPRANIVLQRLSALKAQQENATRREASVQYEFGHDVVERWYDRVLHDGSFPALVVEDITINDEVVKVEKSNKPIAIGECTLIKNSEIIAGFVQQCRRMRRETVTPPSNLTHRNVFDVTRVRERLSSELVTHRGLNFCVTYHGCSPDTVDSIVTNGIRNLRFTDNGYFGSGCYSTFDLKYALRYARSRPGDGFRPVVVCLVVTKHTYAITRDDYKPWDNGYSQFRGRGMVGKGFDSHFVIVSPSGQATTDYDRADNTSELVTEQEFQNLPLGVLWIPSGIGLDDVRIAETNSLLQRLAIGNVLTPVMRLRQLQDRFLQAYDYPTPSEDLVARFADYLKSITIMHRTHSSNVSKILAQKMIYSNRDLARRRLGVVSQHAYKDDTLGTSDFVFCVAGPNAYEKYGEKMVTIHPSQLSPESFISPISVLTLAYPALVVRRRPWVVEGFESENIIRDAAVHMFRMKLFVHENPNKKIIVSEEECDSVVDLTKFPISEDAWLVVARDIILQFMIAHPCGQFETMLNPRPAEHIRKQIVANGEVTAIQNWYINQESHGLVEVLIPKIPIERPDQLKNVDTAALLGLYGSCGYTGPHKYDSESFWMQSCLKTAEESKILREYDSEFHKDIPTPPNRDEKVSHTTW